MLMGIFKKKKSVAVKTDLSQSSLGSKSRQEIREVYLKYDNFSSLKVIQAPPFKALSNIEKDNFESVEYVLVVERDNMAVSGDDIYSIYAKWMVHVVEKDPHFVKLFKELMKSDSYFVHNLFNDSRVSLRDVKLGDELFITPFHKKDLLVKLSDRELLKNMSAIGNLLLKDLIVKEIITLKNEVTDNPKSNILFENSKQSVFERQLNSNDEDLNFKDIF